MSRSPLARLPAAWHETAALALAAVVTALLWLFAVAMLIGTRLGGDLTWVVGVYGLMALLLSFLLRPWFWLSRLGQPLAPRRSALGLLAPTLRLLHQRDALARALGWTAAITAGLAAAAALFSTLQPRWSGGVLDGREAPVAAALGLLVAVASGVALHGLPKRWAQARLAGLVDGRAASTALALGANLMLTLAAGLAALMLVAGMRAASAREFQFLAAIAPAATLLLGVFVVAYRVLLPRPPATSALWLALLPANAAPHDDRALRTLLALVQQLAAGWRDGPVTVLLPDTVPVGGEHLLAARTAGRGDALFPGLAVQLVDWQRTLPPDECWHALPLRELHLPRGQMPGAARDLLRPADRLLLVAAADADVAPWQPLLRDHASGVCRVGAAPLIDAAAALDAHEMRARRLRQAALAWLQPLRPQSVLPAAATAIGADLARAGVPTPPKLRRLALFISASALLALGGFVVLTFQLAGASDLVFARLSALSAPSVPQGPATEARVAELQRLLAEPIASGLLTVSGTAAGPTVTVASDRLFDAGSASVQSSAVPLLRAVATALQVQTGPVAVQAHTDNVPVFGLRYASNFALSQARADAVAAALANTLGRGRLSAAGRGDTQPVASNDTPPGRALNRRVELVLLPAGGAGADAPTSPGSPTANIGVRG